MNFDYIFYKKENLKNFYEIYRNTLFDKINNIRIDINDFETGLVNNNINKNSSFIVLVNMESAGFFISGQREENSNILAVGVKHEYRKRGLGTHIMKHGLSLLKESSKEIILEVDIDNFDAVNFYKKFGFTVKNELLNLELENNFIYINDIKSDNNLLIEKSDNFTFHILFNTFKNKHNPWIRQINYLLNQINKNDTELYLIKKVDKIKGYILIKRKKNSINIIDIGLNEYNPNYFNCIIKEIINGEKIIKANNFYSDDPAGIFLVNNGFNIVSRQYEMKKDIL